MFFVAFTLGAENSWAEGTAKFGTFYAFSKVLIFDTNFFRFILESSE